MHRSSTLPPTSISAGFADDNRARATSDPQTLVPEPFQSIPAQELLKDNCRHCGWIRKEGGSIKTWNDRYTIIHKGCLYYYYKPESTNTAGKFSLSGYRLSPAPEKSSKYQWTFKLVHLQPEKRTYYFAAYSEKEMNEWMEKITEDMTEYVYCGTVGRQSSPNRLEQGEDSVDYSYPEVEPKIDTDFQAVLRQHIGSAQQSQQEPDPSDPLYCPPPDVVEPPRTRKPRKLPPVPGESRQEATLPGMSKFSYLGDSGLANRPRPVSPVSRGAPSAGPRSPRCSPIPPRKDSTPPSVPLRPRKPPPGKALQFTPPTGRKPATRPGLRKYMTEPNMKPLVGNNGYEGSGSKSEDDECGEEYLDIVPDTNPQDVQDQGKMSTLQRGFPEGRSFRRPHNDDPLPPSALRLDLDKTQVATFLNRKPGVYIMRESKSTQTKRALSVWTGEKVSHYLVFYDQKLGGYALDPDKGARCSSIEELLWHYYDNNLPNTAARLSMPYK